MINYSFIIPHKNVPKLLERCINSIPHRSDVEIIVVDDCSDDKDKLKEFDFFKRENVRILFLKQSKGAGFARNEGLKIARGKWLLFADADDYYTSNINYILEKYVLDNITDVVYLNAQSVDEKECNSPLLINRYINNFHKKKIYSEKVLRFANWVPWTRMVKRVMVEKYNIRYEEIPVGNDAMFCLTCSKYAEWIKAESLVVYNYYKPSAGSCTYHYYKISNLGSMIDLRFRINRLYKEVGFIFKQNFIKNYLEKNKMIDDKEYKLYYMEALKRNNYSLIKDIVNTVIYYIGKILCIL